MSTKAVIPMGRKKFEQSVYDYVFKKGLEEGMDSDAAQKKAKFSAFVAGIHRKEARREQKKMCARRRRGWHMADWDETRKPLSVWLPPELRKELDEHAQPYTLGGRLTLEQARSEIIVSYLEEGMQQAKLREQEEREQRYKLEQNVLATQSYIRSERKKGTPEAKIAEDVKNVMHRTIEQIENFHFEILNIQPT